MHNPPMTQSIALAILAGAGVFLVVLGVTALRRPQAVRQLLLGFADTATRHFAELAVRLAVGAALVVASPRLAGTAFIAVSGWVLLVTTALMLLFPWRLHRAFAVRVVPKALLYLPAIGFSSMGAGLALLWALFNAGAA